MEGKKFNPKKLEKLNNIERLKDIPPEFIRKAVGLVNVETLVDIGAGTGLFSVALLNEFKCKTVYACDLSDIMIDWMKENIVTKYSEIIPLKSDETKVPLSDDIAELAVMISLHHELNEPEVVLKDVYRILRKGGKLLVIDWKKAEMNEGPPLDIRVCPDLVKKQLLKAGFENIQVFDGLKKHFAIIGDKR
ncbi:class I SAM-dependent methyltransferase [Deferribacterales bacterium Es71-Z0220]|uniref:class I SAM-dependent methyltransferase n=1 Tax=Deferrivibrio essentukiensis TaxID=2880922 RepID=UPI001F60E36D|nr:rRNA (adenine-N6)-methyltransferase [Deferribacteraceae bacterium]MCB4205398.1 class I SAM-dependent methyltransferase [Deferrivibrio essentukiensis]